MNSKNKKRKAQTRAKMKPKSLQELLQQLQQAQLDEQKTDLETK